LATICAGFGVSYCNGITYCVMAKRLVLTAILKSFGCRVQVVNSGITQMGLALPASSNTCCFT
jgi:hypothetical protein